MKKFFKGIGIGLVVVGGITLSTAVIGGVATGKNYIMLTYDKIIGKKVENNRREVFKESKSYVEGMIKDLSNYKREYDRTDDEIEKKSIANLIDTQFANFDDTLIESDTLYMFLQNIRKGKLN